VEIFIVFFYLVGEDLLNMVEESRLQTKIHGAINSTYLALIPKRDKLESFKEFKPIALCNLTYKVIAEIIALRLKPKFYEFIFKEKFSFLPNQQIIDVIGIAQERLHTTQSKKREALILKMDLVKAYDPVDWGFLRMLFMNIGFPYLVTEWIMACVSSTNYVVLVNGHPTEFFPCGRGLRQGCPLSPYLFL